MQRIISLALVAAMCGGVYGALASRASTDVAQVVRSCKSAAQGQDAVDACDELLRVERLDDADRGLLLFHKAMALRHLDDDAGALAAYDRSAMLRPKRRSTYHNRALIHWRAERWDLMVADAEKLITDWPDIRDRNYFGAVNMLRVNYRRIEDHAAADEMAQLFLTERPQDETTLKRWISYLGRYFDADQRQEALLYRLRDIAEMIKQEPTEFHWIEQRSDVLIALRLDYISAQARADAYAQVVLDHENAPWLTDAQLTEATSRLRPAMSRSIRAQDWLAGRGVASGSDPDNMFHRHIRYWVEGRLDAATAELNGLVEMQPHDSEWRRRMTLLKGQRVVLGDIGLLHD